MNIKILKRTFASLNSPTNNNNQTINQHKVCKQKTYTDIINHAVVCDLDDTLLFTFFYENVGETMYNYINSLAVEQEHLVSCGSLKAENKILFILSDLATPQNNHPPITLLRPGFRQLMIDFVKLDWKFIIFTAGGELYTSSVKSNIIEQLKLPSLPLLYLNFDSCHKENPDFPHVLGTKYVYTKPLTVVKKALEEKGYSLQNGCQSLVLFDDRIFNGYFNPSRLCLVPRFKAEEHIDYFVFLFKNDLDKSNNGINFETFVSYYLNIDDYLLNTAISNLSKKLLD